MTSLLNLHDDAEYGARISLQWKLDEYRKKMTKISKMTDVEARHSLADELMVKILIENGYREIAVIFDNMDKWYT